MKHDLEKQRKRENYGKKIKIKNYVKAKERERKRLKKLERQIVIKKMRIKENDEDKRKKF